MISTRTSRSPGVTLARPSLRRKPLSTRRHPQSRGPAERYQRRLILYVIPALLVLVLLIGYPVIYGFLISLRSWNLLVGGNTFVGGANYRQIVGSAEFQQSLILTGLYTGVGTVIELLCGLSLALLVREGLRRSLRGFGAIRVVLLLPVAIAPMVWAFYFAGLMEPTLGPFSRLLAAVHGPTLSWFNSPHTALLALMVVDIWQWSPFMFTLIIAGLLALPPSVREAAELDGAGFLQRLWAIELPLLRPVLTVAILLRLITSIQDIEYTYVLTQGGPGRSTNILNFFSYHTAFINYELGLGSAIGFVVLALTVISTLAILYGLRMEVA